VVNARAQLVRSLWSASQKAQDEATFAKLHVDIPNGDKTQTFGFGYAGW